MWFYRVYLLLSMLVLKNLQPKPFASFDHVVCLTVTMLKLYYSRNVSQWPWPLTFDRQNLISSSLSDSEHCHSAKFEEYSSKCSWDTVLTRNPDRRTDRQQCLLPWLLPARRHKKIENLSKNVFSSSRPETVELNDLFFCVPISQDLYSRNIFRLKVAPNLLIKEQLFTITRMCQF